MINTDEALFSLAQQIGERLLHKQLRLCTAESCTGGWVAKVMTDVAGSSQWFDRGFVTYSNQAKEDMLDVSAELLRQQGAVSEATVAAMASGALVNSAADLSVAISGIAGPDGGSEEKPLGLVCFAWAARGIGQDENRVRTAQQRFAGDREAVRRQAVRYSLQGVNNMLQEQNDGARG